MAVQRDKVIASAEKLVAKGKIEPAIKEYERLLDDNPNDVNTLNRIGDLWVRINRNDEAVKVFTKIADHYSRDGFFLKAIAIYKKINKLDPSKLEIYGKLADLYAKQGLAMEAKSQYQVLADYYLKHGDPGNALAIYRKISELDPNSINVHVKLADLYSQNNQTGEALKEYDRVGRMLLKRGMLDEAVQVFKKALKIDAKNVELVDSLVAALLDAKDYDNAQQIVEAALDMNRENARLLALWGRILIAKGDVNSARNALERGLASDPNEPSIREALAELYLKQGNAAKALEMLAPLSEKALARGERGAAVDMLNRVLRVNASHTQTLERLVGVYSRLNEETNILASMNSLAEAHIAKGNYDDAAKVLDKLIQREPQNAQHRTKLQFVQSQMGGIDTMPARAKSVEKPMPAMEIEEPVPSFDIDEAPALSLDLDASPAIELDLDAVAAAEPPPPPPRSERLPAAVDIAAQELDQEGGDDLDFITEHLTEAEVFAKYGLAEKAAEHLRAVIDRAPKNLTAHERLYRILLDEADLAGARTAAGKYIALLNEKGDDAAIEAVRNEFAARGHALEAAPRPAAPRPPTLEQKKPSTVERPKPPTLERPKPPTLEAPAPAEEEFAIDFDSPSEELTFDLDAGAAGSAAAPIEIEETFEPEPAAADDGFGFGDLASSEPEIAFGQEQAPEPFFGTESGALPSPSPEEIGEIDFYIDQELFDEARAKASALLERYPGDAELQSRLERIETMAAAAAAPPPAPARPPVLSRDEIESELMSAIPEDEEEFAPPPPPPAAPPPPPQPVAPVHEENLFADEDSFFDLAAELESELTDDEPIALAEEEQSLEEIFKEFKKGVEQQLDAEDYDTHYNLGIAYKEMGLIDEAIGEFQLASKDPKRAVECSSMLGLCFLEKGMPQLAIKWYRKGLEIPEITEEEHIGLLYDLGSAYVEVGDTANAQKAFMEVYGMNTNYRDVVSRIKQLEGAT
jgi:tetratricopeptide (TPR) repeat protein